jgi:ABC-type amino acid transport system permease subunit
LLIAALIYLALTLGLSKLFGRMERRLGVSDRR